MCERIVGGRGGRRGKGWGQVDNIYDVLFAFVHIKSSEKGSARSI